MGIKTLAQACIAAVACGYQFSSEMDQRFLKWLAEHGRNYHNITEYTYRLAQFAENHEIIRQINEKPGATSFVGHNKFSDWTREERSKYAKGAP